MEKESRSDKKEGLFWKKRSGFMEKEGLFVEKVSGCEEKEGLFVKKEGNFEEKEGLFMGKEDSFYAEVGGLAAEGLLVIAEEQLFVEGEVCFCKFLLGASSSYGSFAAVGVVLTQVRPCDMTSPTRFTTPDCVLIKGTNRNQERNPWLK